MWVVFEGVVIDMVVFDVVVVVLNVGWLLLIYGLVGSGKIFFVEWFGVLMYGCVLVLYVICVVGEVI